MKYNKQYWIEFYKSHRAINEPSAFALFCRGFMNSGCSLLDVGAGDLRDSRYFDSEGLFVTAIDIIDRPHDTDIMYIKEDLTEHREFMDTVRLFDYVYIRFLLHVLPEETEDYIIEQCQRIITKGGLLFIETKSDKEASDDVHYRRPDNINELIKKLSNFDIIYKTESRGLSVHKDKDPVLIRIICRR